MEKLLHRLVEFITTINTKEWVKGFDQHVWAAIDY